MNLNKSQQALADHHSGPLLVISVAGSGKTTTVVKNLENKHNMGIDLRKVMVTAFNKDAAEQIKHRMVRFYPLAGHENSGLPVATSHSLFYKMLRECGLRIKDIYRDWQAQAVLRDILGERYKDGEDAEVYGKIGFLKNNVAYYEDIPGTDCYDTYMSLLPGIAAECEVDPNDFTRAFAAYEKDKAFRQSIDIDDMLFKCWCMFTQKPETLEFFQRRYEHLIVDEYQDTNEVQYRLFKMLVEQHENFIAVGDDDQAIYSFRGSYPKYIRRFKIDFPDSKLITMDLNYRSQSGVIGMANQVIAQNEDRYEKQLQPTREHIANPYYVLCKDQEAEAEFIAQCIQGSAYEYKDIAILTRVNMQQAILEQVFSVHRIPYEVGDGTSFFNRKEIKTLLNYLRIAESGIEGVGIEIVKDIANKPYRKFSSVEVNSWTSVQDINELGRNDNRAYDFYEQMEQLHRLAHKGSSLTDLMDYIINKPVYFGSWANRNAGIGSDSKPTAILGHLAHLGKAKTVQQLIQEIQNIQAFYSSMSREKNRVNLSTIHRAKGLEWEEVYVPGCYYEMFPHKNSTDIEEERRLFYVAITRAKSHLILSSLKAEVPSPFIDNVMELLDCDDMTMTEAVAV